MQGYPFIEFGTVSNKQQSLMNMFDFLGVGARTMINYRYLKRFLETYEGRSKLLILLQQKMDVIGFELDLIVLQCFEFVAYL